MSAPKRPPPPVDVRAALVARWRHLAAQYSQDPVLAAAQPWTARADRVEAGETVEVYGWELPGELTGRFGPDARLSVAPGGTVTVIHNPEEGPIS